MRHILFIFKMIISIFIISLNIPSFSFADQLNTQKIKLEAPLFTHLGSFHYPISTDSILAQQFFDQGFILFYGFEWSESVRSFKEATRLDPNCGMCYWGLALALGYKGNAPMTGHEHQDAKAAIEKAATLKTYGTSEEKSLISALALRFQHPTKQALSTDTFSCRATTQSEIASKNDILNYVTAMKKITKKYLHNQNARAVYACALFMDVMDWKFQSNNTTTLELLNILQSILAKDKLHIGANHYYIHVIEQSPQPEKALKNANRLRTLVPGSEHLVHMPAHIYFLTGRYHEATNSNLQAIAAYKKYSEISHAQGFEPEVTYLYHHDFDFLRTSAAMEGRKKLALSAAQELMDNLPAIWMQRDITLQWFIPISYYVKTRFNMWDELLQEPAPNTKYQYALGMWHYARGMALAHTNDIKQAENQSSKLQEIIARGPKEDSLGKNGIKLLTIANETLSATLADSHQDEKSVISHLTTAMQLQNSMGYHEPPDWYFPLRQALADAYLKYGHSQKAIELYKQDLKQYPNNAWSLFGLYKSFQKLGQEKKANELKKAFDNAWQYSDVKEPSSLFLR